MIKFGLREAMTMALAMVLCLLLGFYGGIMGSQQAHAGWWSDWCEKNLIAADPYQFREAPTAWIEYRIYYLEVQERANMLSNTDRQILKVLKQELEWRK